METADAKKMRRENSVIDSFPEDDSQAKLDRFTNAVVSLRKEKSDHDFPLILIFFKEKQ
jgi:hypothetical protein